MEAVPAHPKSLSDLPLVVVVGGGFGGIRVVQRLARAPVRVVLIDRSNHHLFQPLLYQVATSVLTESEIAYPIRRIFRSQANALVGLGEVRAVDRASRSLIFADGTRAPYDWLVLAAGAVSSYFGKDGWSDLAPGMKTLNEATAIRARVLQAFEDAEAEVDPQALRAHLTFVIVGGGATGVELAGAIRELAVEAMAPDFRRVRTETTRVILVEASPRLLSSMSDSSGATALAALKSLGVEVRLNSMVTDVFDGGVVVGGERIDADTVVWAAGVCASPISATLGAELDSMGRVKVLPDCSVPGTPEVFVIGDMAYQICAKTGQQVPGVAPGAIQMAEMVSSIIAAETKAAKRGTAAPKRPAFRYLDRGSMATIGRARAVAEVSGVRLHGLSAWLAWLLVHLVLLVGFRNRLFVLLSWAFAYIAYSKGARLITGQSRSRLKTPLGEEMKRLAQVESNALASVK